MDIFIFSHQNRIKYLMESYGVFNLPNTGMIKLKDNKAQLIYPKESQLCFSLKFNLPSFFTIYLIRHAEGEHNIHSLFKTYYDPGLTQNGVKQSELLGKKIKELINPQNKVIFCASELYRTQETAKIVIRELVINTKIKILPNIGEIIFENKFLESIVSHFIPENKPLKKNWKDINLDWNLFFIKTDEHLFDLIFRNKAVIDEFLKVFK
jgi:hypothetical protein